MTLKIKNKKHQNGQRVSNLLLYGWKLFQRVAAMSSLLHHSNIHLASLKKKDSPSNFCVQLVPQFYFILE